VHTAAGPADLALPLGTRVRLDRRARVLDGGRVLLGGAPPRLLYLAPPAQALIEGDTVTVADRTSAELARRLVDAGIGHPVELPAAAVLAAADVAVVVPVKDRAAGLARLLAALPTALGGVIVVDDGSADPPAIRAAAGSAHATVLRHARSRGPAAARNSGLAAATTPLVAFLDSDVVPEPGWLDPLLAAFADPAVGLAAPRIVALPPVSGWLGRYEAVRSSLDLGPDPALVVPRSRVAYVPSAALVVRRAAAGPGFDERMQVAEDVDLVLRLHGAGWRLRYEPAARVAHDHRTGFAAWWLRKAYYGTGAAPLAVRHRGAVPPMVLTPTSAGIVALLLTGRPLAVPPAAVIGGVAVLRLARRLRMERPHATAAQLVALGTLGAAAQTADAVNRHYWPLSLLACLLSRRARRTVATIALVEGVVDWWRYRDRDPRVRTTLPEHLLAHRLDDLAYGAGLWWGAWRQRSWEPLRPVGPGTAGAGVGLTQLLRRVKSAVAPR
jgi:mycofactocin glycosyltransferase